MAMIREAWLASQEKVSNDIKAKHKIKFPAENAGVAHWIMEGNKNLACVALSRSKKKDDRIGTAPYSMVLHSQFERAGRSQVIGGRTWQNVEEERL